MPHSAGSSPPQPSLDVGTAALARVELVRLCAYKLFRKSAVLQRMLGFLVESELSVRTVTENLLAKELLGLSDDQFHPYTNSYIRVNMSQLRKRLAAYYQETPHGGVRFHLPQGSFRLRIEVADATQDHWRRMLGQAKLLASSRYLDELELGLQRINEVIAAQPTLAPAYALKSMTHLFVGSHGGDPRAHALLARNAADQAIQLAPDAWESLAAAGGIASLLDWNWAEGDRLFARAAAVPGNELVADPWYIAAEVALNRLDTCLAEMRRALAEFPVPPRQLQQMYGSTLHLAGKWEEAEAEMIQTAEIYPDDYSAWFWRGMQAIALGNRAKAAPLMLRGAIISRGRMPGTLIQSVRDFLLTGKFHPPGAHPGGVVEIGKLVAGASKRRPEFAIGAVERMVESKNVLAAVFLRGPMQTYLHCEPRFLALFDRMGIPRPGEDPAIRAKLNS